MDIHCLCRKGYFPLFLSCYKLQKWFPAKHLNTDSPSWGVVHRQYEDLLQQHKETVDIQFKFIHGSPEYSIEMKDKLETYAEAELLFIFNEHDFLNIGSLMNLDTICQLGWLRSHHWSLSQQQEKPFCPSFLFSQSRIGKFSITFIDWLERIPRQIVLSCGRWYIILHVWKARRIVFKLTFQFSKLSAWSE